MRRRLYICTYIFFYLNANRKKTTRPTFRKNCEICVRFVNQCSDDGQKKKKMLRTSSSICLIDLFIFIVDESKDAIQWLIFSQITFIIFFLQIFFSFCGFFLLNRGRKLLLTFRDFHRIYINIMKWKSK